jgi:hypothetical protein
MNDMSSPDTLYLHIGLPKTATTYLQQEVFPALSHLRYLGIPQGDVFAGPEELKHGPRTLTNCTKRSALVWSRYGEAVFRDIFGCEPTERPLGDVLLSDEGIGRAGSRPTFLGAHLQGLATQAKNWGFGRIRLLCMFRRQDRWLASHYAQISDRNPQASQEDFEATVSRALDPAGERFGFGMLLDYAALARHLRPVVGPSNLLMLPYEFLVHDPAEFHHQVLAFLGKAAAADASLFEDAQKRNVRSKEEGVWELRPARYSRAIQLRPGRLFSSLGLPSAIQLNWLTRGGTIRVTESLHMSILSEYEASNRTLSEELEMDLTRFGYLPAE